MKAYEATLKGRLALAEGTMAFRFSRPEGFAFNAGQAIRLELIDPPAEPRQSSRSLSLVSAPFESELLLATRMRDSAFKRALKALPEGASVKINGPSGRFGLEEPGRPAVFVAGGIGITPFISMLRQAAHERSPQQLYLAYSNRRPEDAAFLEELQQLARQNPRFRLLATMTDMGKSALEWNGATGHIDAEKLQRLVGDLSAPIFYIVGPPAMVEAMQAMLSEAGVTEEAMRSEEFYGY